VATLAEIIARAEQIAIGRGMDSSRSPVTDSAETAEQLYNAAVRLTLARMLKRGENLQEFVRPHAVTFAGGVGALPDEVLRSAIKSATFAGNAFVSYLPYADYKRPKLSGILSYFSILGNEIYFEDAETDAEAGFSGSQKINFVTVPAKPASPTTDTGLSLRHVEEVVLVIAMTLTGELPITELLNTEVE
jgi:hypothetical protein